MIDNILKIFKENCEKAIDAFSEKLATFHTGRANSALVENLMVETYGTKMPLKSLASISVPETKLIVIQPWDRNSIVAIEKAILTSNLGLSPQTEGNIIRVIIPPLTGERRVEYQRLVNKEAERSRIVVRNYRRQAMDEIKQKKDNKELSEDEEKRAKEMLQKEVDLQIGKIDKMLEQKLTELEEI